MMDPFCIIMAEHNDGWRCMRLNIEHYNNEIAGYIGMCPYCGHVGGDDELQTSDYATHVMWWGWKCRGKYAIVDASQNSDEINHPLCKRTDEFVLVPMLLVKKMINSQIRNEYKQITGRKIKWNTLTDEDKLKFINDHGAAVNDWDPMVMGSRGYDMSHDGIYIHLYCEDVFGKPVLVEFWGD